MTKLAFCTQENGRRLENALRSVTICALSSNGLQQRIGFIPQFFITYLDVCLRFDRFLSLSLFQSCKSGLTKRPAGSEQGQTSELGSEQGQTSELGSEQGQTSELGSEQG